MLLVSFFLIIVIIVLFSFFKDYFTPSTSDKNSVSASKSIPIQNSFKTPASVSAPDINTSISQIQYFYEIHCVYNDCKIEGYFPFSYKFFMASISQTEPLFIEYRDDSKGFLRIFAYFDKPIFEKLKKEVKNEKDNFSTGSVVKSAFGK